MSVDQFAILTVAAHVSLQILFVLRALLRQHREAATRTAWILIIVTVPVFGIAAYVLFGETNIGQKRLATYVAVADIARQRATSALTTGDYSRVDERFRHLFKIGSSVNGLAPVVGNTAEVFSETDEAFDSLVNDINAAQSNVHLLFYIWLNDRNGARVAEAAVRAARRGVAVRVMVDDIGSRAFLASSHWHDMQAAGVKVASALPVRPLFLHPIKGRIDLRNHRKIVVVDNRIGYCGSLNCADPGFAIKPKFAPWVDVALRFEGPIAAQMQFLFSQDWMVHTGEDITGLACHIHVADETGGLTAQVIGTGPTIRASAMPEIFETLIHSAREQLLITTPYFVPSDGIQSALCSAGRRGVQTELVLPQRNDSWIVAAASRSYYPDLIEAGVKVYEYPKGMLHAKILTIDGEISFVGSANLDRRSFELNYENNVLVQSSPITSQFVKQQRIFSASSQLIDAKEIARWPTHCKLWHNALSMMGPVL